MCDLVMFLYFKLFWWPDRHHYQFLSREWTNKFDFLLPINWCCSQWLRYWWIYPYYCNQKFILVEWVLDRLQKKKNKKIKYNQTNFTVRFRGQLVRVFLGRNENWRKLNMKTATRWRDYFVFIKTFQGLFYTPSRRIAVWSTSGICVCHIAIQKNFEAHDISDPV